MRARCGVGAAAWVAGVLAALRGVGGQGSRKYSALEKIQAFLMNGNGISKLRQGQPESLNDSKKMRSCLSFPPTHTENTV